MPVSKQAKSQVATTIYSPHILVLSKCFCTKLWRMLSAHRAKSSLSAPFFIFFGNWLQSACQSESWVQAGNSSLKNKDSYQFASQPDQTGNVLVHTKCSKWCLQFKLFHIFLVFRGFFPLLKQVAEACMFIPWQQGRLRSPTPDGFPSWYTARDTNTCWFAA